MKKMVVLSLCIVLLLPLFSCAKGKRNNLWAEASPETSAMFLYSFDEDGGKARITFNQEDEHAILDRLSSIKANPVSDWTADKVALPVYGIEIGSKDGWGVHAAWSNGYLILRDGSVYEFDFDFSALVEDYAWEDENRTIKSLSEMPCGRLLSEDPESWLAPHLTPVAPLTPPEGISMVLKEQAAESLTVELTNSGDTEWCYGEYFSLNVLLDNVWYDVPVLDDMNYGFTDIGILLPAGESQEEIYNLSMYGTLPDGTYRLVVEGMCVEFVRPFTEKSIISIVDHSLDDPGLAFDMAEEPIWEDENNIYCLSCIKSHVVTVSYANGSEENVKTALQAGHITMADLDRFGIHYWKQSKDEVTCVEPPDLT